MRLLYGAIVAAMLIGASPGHGTVAYQPDLRELVALIVPRGPSSGERPPGAIGIRSPGGWRLWMLY